MITATTRRCPRCTTLLDGDEKACPTCGREQAPPISVWPDGSKRFLFLLTIVDALWSKLEATEQQQFEWILENAMRGKFYEGRLVAYAATAAECYAEFVILLAKWHAAGAPTDFAAIARLRGMRHG